MYKIISNCKIDMNVNFIYKNKINFISNKHSYFSPFLIIVESNEIIEKLIYMFFYMSFIKVSFL